MIIDKCSTAISSQCVHATNVVPKRALKPPRLWSEAIQVDCDPLSISSRLHRLCVWQSSYSRVLCPHSIMSKFEIRGFFNDEYEDWYSMHITCGFILGCGTTVNSSVFHLLHCDFHSLAFIDMNVCVQFRPFNDGLSYFFYTESVNLFVRDLFHTRCLSMAELDDSQSIRAKWLCFLAAKLFPNTDRCDNVSELLAKMEKRLRVSVIGE